MQTVSDLISDARISLSAAGIASYALDVRVLVEHACGIGRIEQIAEPDRVIDTSLVRALYSCINRRVNREPLAYITGEREFWGLPISVSRDTLIPRPESETVVTAALKRLRYHDGSIRILDLGTGSGCLMLALLSEWPRARAVGIDQSFGALKVARTNALRFGFESRAEFVSSNWTAALTGTFDVIVCNPPYLTNDCKTSLAPEISAYEPPSALYAGDDGLYAYREILSDLRRVCHEQTQAFIEIAPSVYTGVLPLMLEYKWHSIQISSDLANNPRCLCAIAGLSPP